MTGRGRIPGRAAALAWPRRRQRRAAESRRRRQHRPAQSRRRRLVRPITTGAAIAWLGFVLISLLASPAGADNCSVFTDCFGQSGAASEAALGLTFLSALSLVVNFIPIVGDVKGVIEAGTGRDLFTGEELEPWERALGLIGLIPGGDLLRLGGAGADVLGAGARGAGAAGDLRGAGRGIDGVADLGSGGRGVEGFSNAGGAGRGIDGADDLATGGSGLGRGADGAGGVDDAGRAAPGDAINHGSHRSEIDRLTDRYDQATTPAQRTRISEQIGERGAIDYLEQASGGRTIDLVHSTSDADVASLVNAFDNGQAWDSAVAFRGSRVTNVVYFDGQTLHIVEAKGGAGRYGDRISSLGQGDPTTGRISQTDQLYPLDVANDMMRSSRTDGRNAIGELIQDAYDGNIVSYVGVRTSGHNTGDEVVTVLEHIFGTPGP